MIEEKFKFEDGCFLNNEPIKAPEAVITEFCTFYSLEEVKLMIWKMFKASMSSQTEVFNLHKEMGDIVFFLENFMMFNMAVFELSKRLEPSG